jgi:RNA polymerase-interacting CarD/CdnL/TRCF family regulator
MMEFQTGDKVIHWNYGLGEILQLDEKIISGRKTRCYMVQIGDLTLWVPLQNGNDSSLRRPTPKEEFAHLFAILRDQAEILADDRLVRKTQLLERLKSGKLEGVCQVIRDLTFFKQIKKLNDADTTILERARRFLLNEWMIALVVPKEEAEQALNRLLTENPPKASH